MRYPITDGKDRPVITSERVEGTEGLIGVPWLRADIPADLLIVAQFVREFGADHDRPRTSEARWGILCRIQREIGAGPLTEVTAAQVRTWWFGTGQVLAAGTGFRSAATRRALLDHFRAFLRWAVAQQLRADDPTAGLPTVRVPRREPRPADRAEVDRVIATTRGPARIAIQLAADLGLRCCEIAALSRDDLAQDDEGWWLWLTRKGGHRLRCVVPAAAAKTLARVPPGKPLVPSRTGGHLTSRGVTKLISRTFARAGSPWRAHTLRHLAATELLAATGGDIVAVADQLGHRDIKTTATYTRSTTSTVRGVLDHRAGRRASAADTRKGATP